MLAARRVSAVEITDACLDRIAQYNDVLHAFIDVYAEERARSSQGRRSRARRGLCPRPAARHSVRFERPRRYRRQGHDRRLEGLGQRISPATGSLVRRLMASGMIVTGKTHTVEFAFGAWGTNQHMGAPRNPWDMREPRTPGGSSSGSGVAVAARMVPWASVPIPAVRCALHRRCAASLASRPRPGRSRRMDPAAEHDTGYARASGTQCRRCGHFVRRDARRWRGCRSNDPLRCGAARKGLRLARMPDVEREGIEAVVLAAYDSRWRTRGYGRGDRRRRAAAPVRRFRRDDRQLLIAMDGYPLSEIVEDPASPIDEEVRKRFRPAAHEVGRRTICVLLQKRELIGAQWRRRRRCRCAADADHADDRDPGRRCRDDRNRAVAFYPRRQYARAVVRWRCRTACLRRACRLRCRSSAAQR